jgi:hypothetical protein
MKGADRSFLTIYSSLLESHLFAFNSTMNGLTEKNEVR